MTSLMDAADLERKIRAYELKRELAKVHGRFKQAFETEQPSTTERPGGQTISRITSRLYLGSKHGESDRPQLKRLGITHILQVGTSLHRHHPRVFEYHSVDLFDLEGEDLLSLLPQCMSFLTKALSEETNRVFVHCQKGVSRSASVVVAFLMLHGNPDQQIASTLPSQPSTLSPSCSRPQHLKMHYAEALEMVKEKRRVVNPNVGFQLQLRLLEDATTWTGFEGWGGWSISHFLEAAERMGDDRTLSSPSNQEPATLIIEDYSGDERGENPLDSITSPFREAVVSPFSPQLEIHSRVEQRSTQISPQGKGKERSPLPCQGPRSPTSLHEEEEAEGLVSVRKSSHDRPPLPAPLHSAASNIFPQATTSLALYRNLSSSSLQSAGPKLRSGRLSDSGAHSTCHRKLKVPTIPDQIPPSSRLSMEKIASRHSDYGGGVAAENNHNT